MAWRGNPLLGYWHRLYSAPTAAEQALETGIVGLGTRYRAQHPFLGLKLIADFALLDDMRIIEVDGKSHDAPAQKKKDLEHMIALKALGWDVVRVTNEQAMANPLETAEAARSAPRTDVAVLQARLDALRQTYPELWLEKPRRQRRKPAKTVARAHRRQRRKS